MANIIMVTEIQVKVKKY